MNRSFVTEGHRLGERFYWFFGCFDSDLGRYFEKPLDPRTAEAEAHYQRKQESPPTGRSPVFDIAIRSCSHWEQ